MVEPTKYVQEVSKEALWKLIMRLPKTHLGDIVHNLGEIAVPEQELQIAEAFRKGLMVHQPMRPSIKLPPLANKIALCIPMGDKDDPDLFQCEHCNRRQFGVILCENCKKESSARLKLRHAGLAPIEWLINAWQIVPPLLCSMHVMVRKSVLSAQARQEMTYEAIKHGCKYIFYWDDDTIIPPKAIYDMHSAMEQNPHIGAMTGVYVTRETMYEPLVYKEHGQGAYWNFDTTEGLHEPVFAAGAGCLLARTEALLDVERILGGAWWEDFQDTDSVNKGQGKAMWGHDIRFCKRLWETHQHDGPGIRTPGPTGWEKEYPELTDKGGFPLDPQTGLQLDKENPGLLKIWVGDGLLRYEPKTGMFYKLDSDSLPVPFRPPGDVEIPVREMTKDDPPLHQWEVHVAGWVQCLHFDIARQVAFRIAPDAPCFKNKNTKVYWDRVWEQEGQETPRQYPELYEMIEKLVPEGSNVVDIGCGVGVLMDRLVKRRKCQVYGYDMSSEAINLLNGQWLDGEVCDVKDLELNHFPADKTVVVSTETIEHLDDARLLNLLEESAKTPLAIFSTPEGDLEGTPDGEHVQVWTKKSLRSRLAPHFDTVEIKTLKTEARPKNPYLVAVCQQKAGTKVKEMKT